MGAHLRSSARDWLGANSVLLVLLTLAASVSILWSISTLPWRMPDEPAHFGYIQYLSREKSVPLLQRAYYYPDVIESQNRTNFRGAFGEETTYIDPDSPLWNSAAGHPPLYYALMLPAYELSQGGAIESQLYFVRIAGALIFMALIAVAYKFAKLLFPKAVYLQVGIPMLLILHPQHAYISSGVMNDSLLTLLFTYFLYQLVLMIKGDLRMRRGAVTGVALGLGMLVKESFLLAFPVGIAVMAVLLILRKGQRLTLLKLSALVFTIPVAVCGWYYLRAYLELGYIEPDKTVERYGAKSWWQLWFATSFRAQLLASFLGFFSWHTIPLNENIFLWFRRISELAAVGVTVSVAVGYLRRGWRMMEPWAVAFFAGIWVLFYLAATHFEFTLSGAQGRYLFPAIFPFWTLALVGLTGWLPPAWRPRLVALLVAAAGCLTAWSLVTEFVPRVT